MQRYKIPPHLARALDANEIESLTQEAPDEASFLADLQMRAYGTPMEYIRGSRAVGGLTFMIDRRVYIPNAESLNLVAVASDLLSDGQRFLDIGTGCGWLSILLKKHRPRLTAYASDIEPGALELAMKNAAHHGVEISFHRACYCYGMAIPEPHVVIADLPYGERAHMLIQDGGDRAHAHQPPTSTFHNSGTLEAYQELLTSIEAKGWKPIMVLEIGFVDDASAAAAFSGHGAFDIVRRGGHGVVVLCPDDPAPAESDS